MPIPAVIPASPDTDTSLVSGRDGGPASSWTRSQGRGCARPASEGTLDESPSRLDGISGRDGGPASSWTRSQGRGGARPASEGSLDESPSRLDGITAATLAVFGLCAVTSPASARDLHVVASFTILADMVREVGGDHVTVRSLVGPNGDPHVYEPTPSDGAALAHADAVFVSGLGLEGWMDRLITASGYKGTVTVASQGVSSRTMLDDDDANKNDGETAGKLITDPHAWNSVANAELYAANIEKALEATDPEDAARFRANGGRYIADLKALDAWVHQEINAIPPAKRKVITSHDAFGYLGAAYGIEFRAPVGFSTEAEASGQQVAALIEQIRHDGIKAVFLENATDPRLVQQIAKETGAQLGGTLYAEALSKSDGPATSYLKMIRYNIETMKIGMLAN